MLGICLHRKGAMEGEKRGVGNISFRWWRKPKCPKGTDGQPQVTETFSLMNNHIGENFVELWWPQPIKG